MGERPRRGPWDHAPTLRAPVPHGSLLTAVGQGRPGHGDILGGQVWERGHTGPWAPDESAWSLSPLSQAGRAPQGQCVGLGLGVCRRRTDYKGSGDTSERACLGNHS